jgi:hypothetical protein
MAFADQDWKKAKKLCRLNEEDIRIAKEMGLNPKSLIKNIPNRDQQWKVSVKDWLRSMWEDRQDKARLKKLQKGASASKAINENYS